MPAGAWKSSSEMLASVTDSGPVEIVMLPAVTLVAVYLPSMVEVPLVTAMVSTAMVMPGTVEVILSPVSTLAPVASVVMPCEVAAQSGELSIADRVHLPGSLTGDDKWQAYADADVFCFPTFYEAETFGIVLIEAMSFGLPVVATRWRGIPEIVDDERTGFLVDPHDAASVANRLEELHDDPTRRRQLSEAGRTKFLQEFTVDRYRQRMEQVFLETAGA